MQIFYRCLAWLFLLMCGGCASIGDINKAFEKPSAAAAKAAAIAQESDKEIIALIALGAVPVTDAPNYNVKDKSQVDGYPSQSLICDSDAGIKNVVDNLGVFTDAITTIDRVAEGPKGGTYAAYIQKFSENQAAIKRNGIDIQKEKDDAIEDAKGTRKKCYSLVEGDLVYAKATTTINANQAFLPGLAGILSLDGLIKSILGAAEQAQRNKAIIATVKNLVPQLEDASRQLKHATNKDGKLIPNGELFQFTIRYLPSGISPDAERISATTLGQAITIRRWAIAQRIKARWLDLKDCRMTKPSPCVTDTKLRVADELATNIYTYRALADVDSDKLLEQLDKAIDNAKNAATTTSLAGLIDSILAIGDTLNGISDKYSGYRKTRE